MRFSSSMLVASIMVSFAVTASEEAPLLYRSNTVQQQQHHRTLPTAVRISSTVTPTSSSSSATLSRLSTEGGDATSIPRGAVQYQLSRSMITASRTIKSWKQDVSIATTTAGGEEGGEETRGEEEGSVDGARHRRRASRAAAPPSAAWNISQTSIVFVKLHKVGGSTVGGVMRRIAHHHGMNGVEIGKYVDWNKDCMDSSVLWAHHGRFVNLYQPTLKCRRKRPVFLVTWVRNVLERCLSMFYHFRATRFHSKTTWKVKRRYCLREIGDGSFIRSVGTWEQSEHRSNVQGWQTSLNFGKEKSKSSNALKLFKLYDFVGVKERFDESLIVLQDVLGLDDSDILYMVSKNSTAGQMGKEDVLKNRTLVPNPGISKEEVKVQELLTDATWIEKNEFALKFTEYANAALDNHIARIGPDAFEKRLHHFKALLSTANLECTSPTPKCYWNDNGCHYDCLDRIAPFGS